MVVVEEVDDLATEFEHGSASMVARDVGVEVEPDTLDRIFVGAVRWQEVEHDFAVQALQYAPDHPAVVDDVVVDDEVDVLCSAVHGSELPRQLADQDAVLRQAVGPNQRSALCTQGASDVVLFILSWSEHAPLHAA